VSVPNQYLEVNKAYTFIVVVTAKSSSSNASVTVTKVGNAIPTVTPLVAHANTFKPSANFITLRVSASICTSESLSYKWRQTSGTHVSLTDVVLTLSSVTLPASVFPSESTYEFAIDVTSSTANTSVSFTVTVVYDALIAVIADGDRVVGASSTFTLDGSKSRDPSSTAETQHYAWSCILENFSACPAALNTLLSQGTTTSIITVALSLPVDTYKFTLVYSKGARTASTTVTIRVVNYSPPSVSVSALPPIIRASSKVSIVGQYDSAAGAATVAWSIVGGDSSLLSEKNLLSKPGDAVLVIKPNILVPGTTYTFRLTVTNSNGDGYAQTSTMVNTAPVHGTISSNPSSGTALSDFTLTSASWTSAQAPLSYYFSIKNGESEVRLTKVSSLNTASVTLPQSVSGNTVQVFAHVIDQIGDEGVVDMNVTVVPLVLSSANASETQQVVTNLLANLNTITDPEKVTQSVVAISDLMPTIKSGGTCTSHAQCNTPYGKCVSSKCLCSNNYVGQFCSISPALVTSRKSARATLFTKLSNSFLSRRLEQSTTIDSIKRQLNSVQYILKDYQQVSPNIIQPTVALLDGFLGTGVQLDETSLQSILQVSSVLLDAMYIPKSVDYVLTKHIHDVLIPEIMTMTLQSKVQGEAASVLRSDRETILVQKTKLTDYAAPVTIPIASSSVAITASSPTVDPTELRIVEQAYNMYDATQIVSSVVSVASTSSATFTLNLTLSGDYSGISSSRGTYGQCVQWVNNAWTPACYAVQISGSVATCSCNGVGEYAVQSVRSTSPPVPAPTLSTGGIVAIAVVSALGVIAAAALFTGSIIACICIYQRKVRNADKERLELTNFSVRSDKYRHDETPATPELELQPMVHRQETFNSVYSTPATPSSPSRMYSANTPTRNSPSTPTQRSYSPFRQQNSYSRSPREESQQIGREQGLLLDVNRPYTPDRRSQGYGGGSPASQTPSPRNRNSYSPVSFLNNND
jgi:hypothetical protein